MRFLRRRPSPAIVISSVALFMSLGGVGYAATQLPPNSVGTSQLRNGAVAYTKIQPGAVGNVRANVRQLQERIWKLCGPNQAMFGANRDGDPKCVNSMPAEIGTTSNTASIPTTGGGAATSVASANLTSGVNYLGLANPTITVTPSSTATGSETATVSCTLTVGSNTNTRSLTITTPDKTTPASAALPLQLTGTGGTLAVSCSSKPVGLPTGATAPTVSVTSAVNAVQIQ